MLYTKGERVGEEREMEFRQLLDLLKGSCFQVQGMSFHGIKASVDAMHRMKACVAPRQ